MNLLWFIVLLGCATCAMSGSQHIRQSSSARMKFCGDSLASTVDWICEGRHNSRFKKMIAHYQFGDKQKDVDYDSWSPFFDKDSVSSSNEISLYHRYRKGIVEECCRRPCSFKYISDNYCEHS